MSLACRPAAARCALEPVTAHVLQLEALEALRSERQQLPIPADSARGKLQQQEAAEITEQCLLAIGDHIMLGTKQEWSLRHDASNLFAFVATATQSRMSGEQLACLYENMSSMRDRQRQHEGAAARTVPAAARSAGATSGACSFRYSSVPVCATAYNPAAESS
jgi:hypothetical protein